MAHECEALDVDEACLCGSTRTRGSELYIRDHMLAADGGSLQHARVLLPLVHHSKLLAAATTMIGAMHRSGRPFTLDGFPITSLR